MVADPKAALALTKLKLATPQRVERLDVQEYIDSVGDPALRVTIGVEGDPERDQIAPETRRGVQSEIWRVLRAVGDERFPYTRFLFTSEFDQEVPGYEPS
jgi:hypothetical protein